MPSPVETQSEAHFIALWGSLLSVGISEAKIYEILINEAGHQTLKVLATQLREEIEQSSALSAFFDDPIRGFILRPWVLVLLFKFEGGDGNSEELGEALLEAGKILNDEVLGRSRGLFWRKVQLLNKQNVEAEDILESLAKDALNVQEEDFSETLSVATRHCRNGKSLPAALAKSAKSFWRSEKLLLASAIGSDDLCPIFQKLSFLAGMREASSTPTRKRIASPQRAPAQNGEKTSEKVKKTISGALSSVGDLLGLNNDREPEPTVHPTNPSHEGLKITPKNQSIPQQSSIEATRNERRQRAEQALGSSQAPLIRVNVKRGESERLKPRRDPNESSTELRAIQKTIGPAWMNDSSIDEPNSMSGSQESRSKTIGFDRSSPAPETPRPPVRVTIAPRNEPLPDIHGPVTIDRLRAYLLLLQDSPHHTIIADQVAEGIVKLRKDMGDEYDPDLEAGRRELDDLELAFGSWKAQHGR